MLGRNNIYIAVLSSKGGEGKGLGNAVVYLGCERSLGYRKNKAKGSVPQVNNKLNSGTKRCNCPFRLKGKEISAATWKLFVIDGNHNHNFHTYNVGRSIISRLSKDEKIKAKELTRAHVPPSQILISIKNENKDNLTTMKQMYYYRQTLRKEEMEGRSVIQQLLSDLCKESYFFSYQVSPINSMVTDLFFANKKAVQLLHQFYYVLIMDCTYKTNRYKMPLLEIIGIVPTGKNFVVGLAFLQDEKKGSFEWALQCTKDLFNPNQIPEVIVTDREFALIHAIGVIFPNSYHMLCTRHIAKNVEARAKKETRSTVFSHAFVGVKVLVHMSIGCLWMKMGPIIATIYNVILVALDPIQMGTLTYLPLYVPEGISSPEKLICIAFLRSYNHFVSVPMINNCPVPEIYRFWYKFREDSVHGCDAPLMARIEKWKSLRG